MEELLIKSTIFVYGTLREGMYNYDIYLKGNARFISSAYVRGELYSIRGVAYPALVPGEKLIVGELYEVENEVLSKVNEMENFYGVGHVDNEYNFVETDILDQHGNTVEKLPVYWYNLSKNKALLNQTITENDYVKYINK